VITFVKKITWKVFEMGISIALTINNVCNMECPHCYLNLVSAKNYITDTVLAKLRDDYFMAEVKEVVVVGKEPLANLRSIDIVTRLAEMLPSKINLSIITNGIGLPHLPETTASHLSEVCLSLDGGPATYDHFRGEASVGQRHTWSDVVASVASLRRRSLLTILHTVSDSTQDIDDMMSMEALDPNKILFSPFVKTGYVTDQALEVLSIPDLFATFSQSKKFVNTSNAFLVLGTHSAQGVPREELREMVAASGLGGKVRWLGSSEQYVRITHDGKVLTSAEALNMLAYMSATDIAEVQNLQQFLTERR
jgi:sulfatase maturation enzyme AslB (radical SAM superfamily)